jgi:branched-chain amino acid transport system substrate-binding protein
MMRWTIRALALSLFAFLNVFPTSGQAVDTLAAETLYPLDPAIEQHFTSGLEAWNRAAYDSAFASFQIVISAPENRRTTAAMLMAGRTLLVIERYGEAVGLLSAFIARYPESRYAEPASKTLELARERYELKRKRDEGVFELGVLLPMSEGAVGFTRSMFTGIRIAVDRFNDRGGRQIRIIFEDSGSSPDRATAAFLRLLDRANPGAVIGPLFSEEAIAVAELADSLGVLLLVPLATDGAVTEERTTVFQANPTYEMRGRLMARYAVQRLRHSKLGVIADSTSYAMRMAQGFEEEALELEADVSLVVLLNGLNDWYSIAERFGARGTEEGDNELAALNALYVPVTGENASGLATVALDEVGLADPQLNLLGNGEWAHVPDIDGMKNHELVYASDFRVDSTSNDVVEFDQQYRLRMSRSPDQPAFVGHDVTSFLLDRLDSISADESLVQAFHDSGEFRGFGVRLYFGDDQVNGSMFFSRFTRSGLRED